MALSRGSLTTVLLLTCQLLRSRKVMRRREKRVRREDCHRKAIRGPSTV